MKTIIKGEMIKWSRERARLSPEEIADKLTVSSEKYNDWESGKVAIPLTVSKKLAKIALILHGLLFVDHPPDERLPIADFRTHTSDILTTPSPELLEAIRDSARKQQWYREYLISEEYEPLKFISTFDIHSDPALVAREIKKTLAIHDTDYLKYRDWKETFSNLMNRAEDIGITVIVNSIKKRSIKIVIWLNNSHDLIFSCENMRWALQSYD